LVLLVAVAVLVLRPWEGEEELPATAAAVVTRVVDGDTVEVRVGGEVEDVRLIGVDTPETVKPDTPVECFGPRASAFTHKALEGERVRLVLGEERRDKYGRLLAYVYLLPQEPTPSPTREGGTTLGRERPLFVNAALVRRGLARTLTIPPNDRFAGRLRRLELQAARAGRGLWSACGP
jgi:micrococcal nuclease